MVEMKLINRGDEGEILLSGKLDSKAAAETENLLKQQAARFDTLILNMKDLQYISSAGLRILKLLHVTMKKKDGMLIIRKANSMVMDVFEMTGFAGLLNIE